MTRVLIGLCLALFLTLPAFAAPGDPRFLQGTVEWPNALTGEPVIIVRGDDGRVYSADVAAARRHGSELVKVGGRVALLVLEGARPHDVTAIVLGAGDAASLARALSQSGAPIAASVVTPPVTTATAPTVAPPSTPPAPPAAPAPPPIIVPAVAATVPPAPASAPPTPAAAVPTPPTALSPAAAAPTPPTAPPAPAAIAATPPVAGTPVAPPPPTGAIPVTPAAPPASAVVAAPPVPAPAPTVIATPPPAVVAPSVSPATPAAPSAPAKGNGPSGERKQWARVDGKVQSVEGALLVLKADNGSIVMVDISQLNPNVSQALRRGRVVSVYGYPLEQKFEAAGYIELDPSHPEPPRLRQSR